MKIFSPIASEESHIIFFILSLLEANAGPTSVSIHCWPYCIHSILTYRNI